LDQEAIRTKETAHLSERGALDPVVAYLGPGGDAPPADAWEAPSGSSGPLGSEERRTEMDERIMAGLLHA
jgi:hypothetical protein